MATSLKHDRKRAAVRRRSAVPRGRHRGHSGAATASHVPPSRPRQQGGRIPGIPCGGVAYNALVAQNECTPHIEPTTPRDPRRPPQHPQDCPECPDCPACENEGCPDCPECPSCDCPDCPPCEECPKHECPPCEACPEHECPPCEDCPDCPECEDCPDCPEYDCEEHCEMAFGLNTPQYHHCVRLCGEDDGGDDGYDWDVHPVEDCIDKVRRLHAAGRISNAEAMRMRQECCEEDCNAQYTPGSSQWQMCMRGCKDSSVPPTKPPTCEQSCRGRFGVNTQAYFDCVERECRGNKPPRPPRRQPVRRVQAQETCIQRCNRLYSDDPWKYGQCMADCGVAPAG